MIDGAEERIIWRSAKGGVVWCTARIVTFVPAVAALGFLAVAPFYPGELWAPALGAVVAALAVGGACAVLSPPVGRFFYLTDRRLVRVPHFGTEDSYPLSSVRGYARRTLGSGY